MVRNRLKTDRILLIWLLATFVWNLISQVIHVGYLATISYGLLILCWIRSLHGEIPDRHVRHRLEIGGGLLILLFVLRFLRWAVTPEGSVWDRLCWYGYYIPILVTPLLSLSLSLAIGSRKSEAQRRFLCPFWVACILLMALVLTNDLHSLVLKMRIEDGSVHSSAQPLYYVYILWYFGLILASFILMLYKCRLSEFRRFLWLPALVESIALVGWLLYYAVCLGSSPRIGGISLYNIQEVFTLIFLGLWESCILIGLIPSASLSREREWIREGVLRTVDAELSELNVLFDRMWDADEPAFREQLIRAGCLGAFIKRRANLELIADERGTLNMTELSLAIRESFDYYSLAGVSVGYEETGNAEIPALLLISAYELFEAVMEQTGLSACYVRVQSSQEEERTGFRMVIEADPRKKDRIRDAVKAGWIRRELLELLGAAVSVTEQDDTMHLELTASYPQRLGPVESIRLSRATVAEKTRGLSGLTGFLSLEQEALAEKIRIHDSLGRGLLMTKRYLECPGEVDRDDLLIEWSRVLVQMNRETVPLPRPSAEPAGERTYEEQEPQAAYTERNERCIRQAGALGVTVELIGDLPEDPRYQEVIDAAITAHITNIRKHTSASRAVIRTERAPGGQVLLLTDDGGSPVEDLNETGGLKNLRAQVETLGGRMELEGKPRFVLRLVLPDKDRSDPPASEVPASDKMEAILTDRNSSAQSRTGSPEHRSGADKDGQECHTV